MEIIKINAKNPDKEKIIIAMNFLKKGGTVIYPTDTVYGLGANIFNEEAVKKVYLIKKRSFKKPMSVCISEIDDINEIAYIDKYTEEIIRKILPGPFTVILRKKKHVPFMLASDGEKIGIRIPDNRVCMELSREFPITTTSANLSGREIPKSVEEVVEQLGDAVDIILDAGTFKHGVPSTVVDMTTSPPKILREGAGKFYLEDLGS